MKIFNKELGSNVQKVIYKYPLVLLSAFIFCGCILYLINWNHRNESIFLYKLSITSSIGISILFAMEMLGQRHSRRLLFNLSGILLLILFYFIFPNQENQEVKWVLTLFLSLLISHLFVAIAPFLQDRDQERFWNYNKSLFIHFIVTSLFANVFSGGLALALFGVRELLNIPIEEINILRAFFIGQIIGGTFIFLLFSKDGINDLEKETPYPIVLKFFVQFILIPLLLLYLVILYLYIGRIVMLQSWPQGWVSYMLQIFSIVGILAILLVHPLKNKTEHAWVSFFGKAFYYSLLPLIIIQYIALYKRIHQYGFTEARLLLLLLSIWLTFIVLYFIFRPKGNIRVIPISLALIAFTATYVPYFNVFSMGIRSQKKEIALILEKNKLIEADGKINFDKSIPSAQMYSITDKMDYLLDRNERAYVLQFLPDSLRKETYLSRYSIQDLFTKVNYKDSPIVNSPSKYVYFNSSVDELDISDFSKYKRFQLSVYGKSNFENLYQNDTELWEIHATKEGKTIELKYQDQIFDLTSTFDNLYTKYYNKEIQYSETPIFIEGKIGNKNFRLYFENCNYSDEKKLSHVSGILLFN